MYSKKPYMISVNPHLSLKESNEKVVGKHVTPMAAVEERAEVEMKETIKENAPPPPRAREDYKNSDGTPHRQIQTNTQKENTSEVTEEVAGLWTSLIRKESN